MPKKLKWIKWCLQEIAQVIQINYHCNLFNQCNFKIKILKSLTKILYKTLAVLKVQLYQIILTTNLKTQQNIRQIVLWWQLIMKLNLNLNKWVKWTHLWNSSKMYLWNKFNQIKTYNLQLIFKFNLKQINNNKKNKKMSKKMKLIRWNKTLSIKLG